MDEILGKAIDKAVDQAAVKLGQGLMEPVRKTIEEKLQTANVILGIGLGAYLLDMLYRHYRER